MTGEDWRVDVELDDEEHGYSLGERLRALDLDDEARARLGREVVVTRDGSTLFMYAATQNEADEAARVVRELARAEGLTAVVRILRWHPVEAAWKDPSVPLPQTDADQALERHEREERERREVESGSDYDWHVHVAARDRAEAAALARRLLDEQLPVRRRWRFLTVDALTGEQAEEIASRIRGELPEAELRVEPTLDLPSPSFVLIRSWL